MMTVGELKGYLEDMDDDIPVQLQTQPNYPLIFSVSNLKLKSEMTKEDEEGHDNSKEVLYICEGSYVEYGDRDAWVY